MVIYPDTSFLVSLYAQEIHNSAAINEVLKYRHPLSLTSFLRFEFSNAMHLTVFRGQITPRQCRLSCKKFEEDIENDLLQYLSISWSEILSQAQKLSSKYTPQYGVRSLDILHIASALAVKADILLTFDSRQAKLAKKLGLKVKP